MLEGFDSLGLPIYFDDSLGNFSELRQVRFPRSKKTRIRKKWAKQRKNMEMFYWQEPVAYVIGKQALVVNSTAFAELKKRSQQMRPPEPKKYLETLRSLAMAGIARDLCIPQQFIDREKLTNYSSARFDLERFQITVRPFTS